MILSLAIQPNSCGEASSEAAGRTWQEHLPQVYSAVGKFETMTTRRRSAGVPKTCTPVVQRTRRDKRRHYRPVFHPGYAGRRRRERAVTDGRESRTRSVTVSAPRTDPT